jgi:hypothetical protein
VLLASICATCFGAYVLTVEKVEFEKKLKRTNVDSPVSHHICVMSVWWSPLVPKCTKHLFLWMKLITPPFPTFLAMKHKQKNGSQMGISWTTGLPQRTRTGETHRSLAPAEGNNTCVIFFSEISLEVETSLEFCRCCRMYVFGVLYTHIYIYIDKGFKLDFPGLNSMRDKFIYIYIFEASLLIPRSVVSYWANRACIMALALAHSNSPQSAYGYGLKYHHVRVKFHWQKSSEDLDLDDVQNFRT